MRSDRAELTSTRGELNQIGKLTVGPRLTLAHTYLPTREGLGVWTGQELKTACRHGIRNLIELIKFVKSSEAFQAASTK